MNEQPRGDQAGIGEWVAELAGLLQVDPSVVDIPLLLSVARDSAHNVEKIAAPLTTFLIGLAAGQRGATADVVTAVANQAQQFAVERGARREGHPTWSG
jgi:hypothetical protein